LTGAAWLLAFVTAQRLGELVYARANERRLRAAGAVEVGAAHYPAIVALHAVWLIALWAVGWDRSLQPAWTVLYLVLQLGRAWVLLTLGRRWSTRVFVLPGETLVARGPYRFVSHPNYVVVACEIFVLPLALGLPWLSLLFGAANLAVLWWRIRVEGRALAELATRPA
jgi:methyltransferase